jgi:hypothetical protein
VFGVAIPLSETVLLWSIVRRSPGFCSVPGLVSVARTGLVMAQKRHTVAQDRETANAGHGEPQDEVAGSTSDACQALFDAYISCTQRYLSRGGLIRDECRQEARAYRECIAHYLEQQRATSSVGRVRAEPTRFQDS